MFALAMDINWSFNRLSAADMESVWKICVRSVKSALYVTLKSQVRNEEILLTILMKIEHCVNSRPLTYVTADPTDDEALTPNHFLLGSSSGEIRFGLYNAEKTCSKKH